MHVKDGTEISVAGFLVAQEVWVNLNNSESFVSVKLSVEDVEELIDKLKVELCRLKEFKEVV